MSSTAKGREQDSTLEAWNVSEDEFPKRGAFADQMHFLVRYAILAPSGHNTQPWLFTITKGNIIEIYADRSRGLPVVDPDDRALIISCAAALYHLRLAANHFGMLDDVDLLPDNDNPDLLAKVMLKEKDPAIQKQAENDMPLFNAITKRRSNRSPFDNKKIPDDLVVSLRGSASAHSTWLDVIDDGRVRVKVIAGEAMGKRAAIETRTPIVYLHFILKPGGSISQPLQKNFNAFGYVVGGAATFGPDEKSARRGQVVIFGNDGDSVSIRAPDDAASDLDLLLIAGVPLNEPIVRYGPFVMNSEQEIRQAIDDYRSGKMGTITP